MCRGCVGVVKSGGAGQVVAEGWRQGGQENGGGVARSRQARAGKNGKKRDALSAVNGLNKRKRKPERGK